MDDRKPKRVLVVDDDRQILEAMRLVLERQGYQVFVASDGHEGLVCAERESPDLIVLDVMMPRRSGFSVLDRLCCRGDSGPRVVVITANDEERHREIARAKGAHRFLHKPFEMGELVRTVNSLLQSEPAGSA